MPKPAANPAASLDVAEALFQALVHHHESRRPDPASPSDLRRMAQWGRDLGLEREVYEHLGLPTYKRPTTQQFFDYLRLNISPDPARFEELAALLKEQETRLIKRGIDRLMACGSPWGRVVRLFWKDRNGRSYSRTWGLHRCKHPLCPACGRSRQRRLADEMERVVELSKDWGFGPEHLRFVTLTVPNGSDIAELREAAHKAWARLQRTRWWPSHVFGWFRGTEVVTGKDGNWNLHLHIVVFLWDRQVSYPEVWKAWEAANRSRYEIDIQTLQDVRRNARGRGTTRAIHYIVKYISKRETLSKLQSGPGGLAHLTLATHKLRSFAVGGGCTMLRAIARVLLPFWGHRAERAFQDASFGGRSAPYHAEVLDPETGTWVEMPPPDWTDSLDDEAWRDMAGPLVDDLGTVGVPCGPQGRFRRVGPTPLPSRPLRLEEHERGVPQEGIRSLVAGGEWAIQSWSVSSPSEAGTAPEGAAPGGARIKRSLLPARRYSWRKIGKLVWEALLKDPSGWGRLRAESYRRWAEKRLTWSDRLNLRRNLVDLLRDHPGMSSGTPAER